jgi:hypothetical protein
VQDDGLVDVGWQPAATRVTLRPDAAAGPDDMSDSQILLACIALIVLEVNHLKWIWWEYWTCSKCDRKNKDCGCSSKWVMFL